MMRPLQKRRHDTSWHNIFKPPGASTASSGMGKELPPRRILAGAAAPFDQHMFLADYCFIKTNAGVTDADEQFATTLVVVDKDTGAVAAMSLPSKEAPPFATEFIASFIDRCGLTKVTLRTDGEASMTSLADNVKDKREHGTILQQAQKTQLGLHGRRGACAFGSAEPDSGHEISARRCMPDVGRGPHAASLPLDRQAQRLVDDPLPRQGDWHDHCTAVSTAGRSLPSAKTS